jgi:tetratricopeptide (TPR) repeat protein
MALAIFLVFISSTSPSYGQAAAQADAHFKRGLQLSLQKKWPQAEAEYRKAIALDPKNATYRSYLADTLAAQGKFEQAQSSYQQSDKIKKTYPQAGFKKPPRKPTSTRPASSTRSVPAKPGSPQTNRTGPKPKTSTSSSTSSSTSTSTRGGVQRIPGLPFPPDDKTGTNSQVITRDGTIFKIPSTGDGEIQVMPADDDPHYIKGVEYFDQENWSGAEVEFRAALKNQPNNTDYWNSLGDVLGKQRKWSAAEQAHRNAVRLDPEESYFHAQLAEDVLAQGRRDEAMKEAREAIRLGLGDHPVFDELGLTGEAHTLTQK